MRLVVYALVGLVSSGSGRRLFASEQKRQSANTGSSSKANHEQTKRAHTASRGFVDFLQTPSHPGDLHSLKALRPLLLALSPALARRRSPPQMQSREPLQESETLPRLDIDSDEESEAILQLGAEVFDNVVCARGVCVISDVDEPELCTFDEELDELVCEPNPKPGLTVAYLWPRALLLICSVLYGTNFPLGRLMNDAMPASAATSTRMLLASVALSPFLLQLKPDLRGTAALCGTFTALGYISQSIALIDTPAATVSFLGALVVVVCPALAVLVDDKKMGFADAPQTWIAAITCLIGVGVLELGGDGGFGGVGWGDLWSVLQAVGFGTSFFITEQMMAKEPTQVLPITAMQCAMSAAIAGIWAGLDGIGVMNVGNSAHGAWLLDQSAASTFILPGLFLNPDVRNLAFAVAFTGLLTTAANRVGETLALGKLSSSEASVLLATEPLWAAVFATFLINEKLSLWAGAGGSLIVLSCIVTAIEPAWLREKLKIEYNEMER